MKTPAPRQRRPDREPLPPEKGDRPPNRWPDFFVVGALKSATTSLHRWLEQHPALFLPALKEPTFFGRDLYSPTFLRDREKYLALFGSARIDQRLGEASPWYLASASAAREIARHRPAARVLVSLRHPVDVMYSVHGQQILNGNEPERDFCIALAQGTGREARRGRSPDGRFFRRGLDYRWTVRFGAQLARYLELFAQQVHVVLFEDLIARPAEVMCGIFEFLGVDTTFTPSFERHNPSRQVRSPLFQSLIRHPSPWTRPMLALPTSLRRSLVRLGEGLNVAARPRPPLDDRIREALCEELDGEITQLAQTIGRDLEHWRARSLRGRSR